MMRAEQDMMSQRCSDRDSAEPKLQDVPVQGGDSRDQTNKALNDMTVTNIILKEDAVADQECYTEDCHTEGPLVVVVVVVVVVAVVSLGQWDPTVPNKTA
jgi:hypothetical protein